MLLTPTESILNVGGKSQQVFKDGAQIPKLLDQLYWHSMDDGGGCCSKILLLLGEGHHHLLGFTDIQFSG